MDEARPKNAHADADTTSAQTSARQEEATNSDTLSDLQRSQTDPAAAQESDAASDSSSAPSPDGMPDNTSGGTADGKDSGGPM